MAVAVATWAGGDDIARAPDAGNAGASSGLDCAPAAVVNRPTEAAEKMVVRYEHIPRHHAAVDQLHARKRPPSTISRTPVPRRDVTSAPSWLRLTVPATTPIPRADNADRPVAVSPSGGVK
ncbi:hypothetical protein EV137_7761 [Kribbella pratensis]|uniref:Uncharacterized protein n=1 Tax=Kribbella pratensis TaxID=2512112 RepID=A0ABY2F5C0_9ACTN|nr:hypothetical protein EV137_7761 [Kribbella pratensis]